METFRPNKLLCVIAHPDDAEFCLGGSIAQWVKAGTEVEYLVCTDGSNGTKDLSEKGQIIAAKRRQEQLDAARTLGVSEVTFLDYQDGLLDNTRELRRHIVRKIRTMKPDTVFCMDPTFYYCTHLGYANHADHRVAGKAAFDAVYPLARDVVSFPELIDEGVEPHNVTNLLMTNFCKSNLFINITDEIEDKISALQCHDSQIPGAAAGDPDVFFRNLGFHFATNQDYEYAEGFVLLPIN